MIRPAFSPTAHHKEAREPNSMQATPDGKGPLIGSLIIASTLFISSCDRNKNTNEPLADETGDQVVVIPPVSNLFGIDVLVLDQDQQPVEGVSLFAINDANNGNIVKDDDESIIAENGVARIELNAFEGNGIVRLEAEKAGYFSNGGRYDVTGGENTSVEIVLTAEDTDTDGIRINEATGNLSEGGINVTVNAKSDPEKKLTEVNIPQDLEILAVDGTPLNDELDVSVVHYDSRDDQALTAFPGGFDVDIENINAVDTPSIEGTLPSEENQQTGTIDTGVTFQSVGFTAIEIVDSDGKKADKFTGSIAVTMAIEPGTENPQTGADIVIGDIIPVWSYDTDTARWVYEGEETVQSDGNGGMQVVYQASHLSYWNLDFYTRQLCNPTINVSVLGSDNQVIDNAPITIKLTPVGNNAGYRRQRTLASGSITLLRVPETLRLSASFTSAVPSVNINSITYNGASYTGQPLDLCNGGNFSVATDRPSLQQDELLNFNYEVTASARCSNSPQTPPIALQGVTLTYYSRPLWSRTNATTNAVGRATIPSNGGITGNIYARYDNQGRWVSVNSSSPTVPIVFFTQCTITTGGVGL